MTESTTKILDEFAKLLEFYNKRVRFYNIELFILTNQVKELEKKLLAYLLLKDKYTKELNNLEKFESLLCNMCCDEISDCIIHPCRHLVCCETCINKLSSNVCPMCREPFETYYKIFI